MEIERNRGAVNLAPPRTHRAAPKCTANRLGPLVLVFLTLTSLLLGGIGTAVGQETLQDEIAAQYDEADPQLQDQHEKAPWMVEMEEGTLATGDLPFYIYIEKGSFTITIYKRDDQGEFTVPVHAWRTAIGRTPGRTPAGVFTLGSRERWRLFDGPIWVQYSTQYDGFLAIHSSFYSSTDIDNLYPTNYGQIGEMITSGCLRTTAEAAYFIYTRCPRGTIVEIVNGSPRGTSSQDPPPVTSDHHWIDPTDPFYPTED